MCPSLHDEIDQSPKVREQLYRSLERSFRKPVISFFTSTRYRTSFIQDSDGNMFEEILSKIKTKKGFILIINSLGGLGLAAERIVQICRTYSNNNFDVIVPNMAKSAATIICFGAKKIWMSSTSELGPIDPQISIPVGEKEYDYVAVEDIIESYEDLVEKANKTKGNIHPYLQLLTNYNASVIGKLKRERRLAKDIAITILKTGMMKRYSRESIENKIEIFTNPKQLHVHGRPIFIHKAKECGLKVDYIPNKSDKWNTIWELFMRLNYLVNRRYSKLLESADMNFYVNAPNQ